MIDSKQVVERYLRKKDWRVQENSNSPYSFGALGKFIIGQVSKDYWLNEVYEEDIVSAYTGGFMHIHDLGGLTLYCCGYSLQSILMLGVQGIPNVPKSKPATHFSAVLNQIANLTTIFQNEIMGAVAFSSFDTLLAPFIKKDELTYKEVKQQLQNYIFSVNSNSRGGAEPAFSNITMDLTPPRDLLNNQAIVGGKLVDYTYKDCQKEMDMLNKAFYELMMEGDASGLPFAYPIPTYNIHDRFDWENPNNEGLWDMAGRYGYPYFANFLNTDMQPEDSRSMCCRLRLDLTELKKRNGGLFGSGDSTGSVGVVTLSLPIMAYVATDEEEFLNLVDYYMDLAKDSLEIKRAFLQEEVLDAGLIPAFKTYVGTLDNHFSTIGLVGMNEMCENLIGKGIQSKEGKQLSMRLLDHMRNRLVDYQKETGSLYNLEATPAESTAYRLAKTNKATFPNIITQGNSGVPYYTNSCHLPVKDVDNIKQIFEHQQDLQELFTGGTVVHLYLDGPISGPQAAHVIKTVCEEYRVPYVTLSPLNRYCEVHGHIAQHVDVCPECGGELSFMQRITGYLRKVDYFNEGKKAEFRDRNQLEV